MPLQPKKMTETMPQNKESAPVFLHALVFCLFAVSVMTLGLVAYELSIPSESQVAAPATVVDPFASVELEAQAAIVLDMESGEILYEKNSDVQLPLASLTKIPLALAVSEALPLDAVVSIPYYTSAAGGSDSLSQGEEWRVQDIIDYTLIASSNDGAEILAGLANSGIQELHPEAPLETATLWRMNEIAKDLNLNQTYFLNVSGLDLSGTFAGAYGSARDMAALFAYAAASNPSLFSATARDGILLTSSNGETRSALNTNSAQGAISGLIMGKTGTTDLAGGNLAVVFDIGLSHSIVAIVLGSSEEGRFQDIQKLASRARQSIAIAP